MGPLQRRIARAVIEIQIEQDGPWIPLIRAGKGSAAAAVRAPVERVVVTEGAGQPHSVTREPFVARWRRHSLESASSPWEAVAPLSADPRL